MSDLEDQGGSMASVILIEDDEKLGRLMKMAVEEDGLTARLFPDTASGIEAFRNTPSDIVIADMIIRENGKIAPDGGISAIWRIKEHAKENGLKVKMIAITGAHKHPGMGNILTTAQSLGADAVLAKPFPPDELTVVIGTLLATD